MKNATLFCALGSLLILCGMAQGQTSRNRRQNNIDITTRGSSDTCADLHASSTGELAQAVEKFDLSRAEVSSLELNSAQNGVVDVRGWKQAGYSVEVCKFAAAEDRGSAETLLRGISVSRSAGRFSFTGPSGSGAWQVHFIIHTPDSASLDLETKNAPISVADVNGNIKVRAANGPVSIRGSSGTIDAQTTNGPISFNGDGGEVHLQAQNGPISVKVQKDMWSGSLLEARTANGPMSVSLPATFQSSVRVEASGHSPLNCKHEACTHALTNYSDDKQVIQMNGTSDTIRIYTENGPLSIGEPKVGQAVR